MKIYKSEALTLDHFNVGVRYEDLTESLVPFDARTDVGRLLFCKTLLIADKIGTVSYGGRRDCEVRVLFPCFFDANENKSTWNIVYVCRALNDGETHIWCEDFGFSANISTGLKFNEIDLEVL